MSKARRGNLLLVLMMALISMLSCFFGTLMLTGDKKISASAETTDITDTLFLGDWGAPESEPDIRYLWLNDYNGIPTKNYAEHWNDNGTANAANNNGIDIMEYIYIDGESARSIVTKNQQGQTSYAGTTSPLSLGGVFAPIDVFSNATGVGLKVLLSYKTSFLLTIKAGFQITNSTETTYTISSDVDFQINEPGAGYTKIQKYTVSFTDESSNVISTARVVAGQAIGKLPEVPAKDGYGGFWTIDGTAITENTIISTNKTATPVYGLEYEDLLGLEDRSNWDFLKNPDVAVFGVMAANEYFKSFTPVGENATCWYKGNTTAIEQNNGVDIMQYIYVNDKSAREWLNENASGQYTTSNPAGWLANPAAWPIAVETVGDFWIRVDRTKFSDNFTFTFKKGFSLVRSDGERIYVSSDITYTYENGTLGGRTVDKKYTLSFDGTDVTKTLSNGATIGELPEVPARDGYEGVWTIDGVEITAGTVYNYDVNKTATVVYSKNITETISLGDWGVPESESDIRYLQILDNGAQIPNQYPYEYWNDHLDMATTTNYGCDMMEYILIDGVSARTLINQNNSGGIDGTVYKGTTTFPLSNGGCYAPVVVMMNGSEGAGCIIMKVLTSYKTSFKVTFKAGFTVVNTDGVRLYTTDDVTYNIGATMGDISKVTGYTLTFEGASSRQLEGGSTIGELPDVPAKDGYTGVWTIDGVEITAGTVYNYGEDKTAVAVYTKDVTDTVTIEFSTHTAVQSTFKIFITPATALCTNSAWNIQGWDTALIAANNGVDIMNYIYVNDENIRELSDNNRTNNTYPVGDATGWPTNSDQCRPVFVETNSEGIWVTVLHSFSGEDYKVTLKAGFSILDSNGGTSVINEDVEFICTSGGGVVKVAEYTLSFEGLDDTVTVIGGQAIGELPKAPENDGCEGYWTIDGVAIDENTVYNYGEDKTAVAAYRKDISKYIALEDRTSWGACEQGGEYYFGVLDMSTISKDGEGNDVNYLSSNNAACWYHGNNAPIDANGGLDIMQYIYINDTSARDLITANVNGDNLVNGCPCWLSNPAASPVYVETSTNAGIMIKVLQAYVGNYFEITFKSGFSIVNTAGVTVYLTKDVTYKYIVTDESTTFAKGELTDDDLDMLNGQTVTLMNGDVEYLVKTTCRLTLPELDPVSVDNGLTQVFVGWTGENSELYPAGHPLEPTQAVTLSAVWIGFEMQDGAAVRLVSGSSGIRFLWDYSEADLEAVGDLALAISAKGTLIVPTDYLATGVEFVHASFSEGYFSDIASEKAPVQESGITTIAAALVNIQEYQYSRSLSARGYIKIEYCYYNADTGEYPTLGEHYIYTPYTEELNARSIYQVALDAYNDEENPQYKTNATILDYINKVADLTWNAETYSFARTDEAKGDYTVENISVDSETATVSVQLSKEVNSALVNGKRLARTNNVNVKLGDYVYNLSDFEINGTTLTFKIGAANETYDKSSEESLYFKSSNADLDFFLNDFFKRHSGVIEDGVNQKVNSVTAGVNSEEFYSHEWMSMSYYWYNSFESYTDEKGNISNRITGLRNFLSTVPVDDYGYVWSSNDRVRDAYTDVSVGEQKMGWPFPNNETVDTKHWEFNSGSESWSSNISASASGGLYGNNLSNQSSNITFTSKSFSGLTSKKVYTFYAPLLEFEVRIDDATNIEDIYVWYTTNSSTSFSEDKKLSVKDNAFLSYNLGNTSGAYNHVLYLPMYAESAWGESTSTYMKQLKIEIALKSGTTISGNVALNYVRPTLDTRMSNNNSILISSLRQDYDFTGDLDYLTENITRARKAMNFLMQMYDSTRGLKKESYLVGHGGTKESLNWRGNATTKSIASSMSQGYWDILYMPEYDFQSNMYFYKALRDMAYLEEVLADNGIEVDNSLATIKTATRNRTTGTSAYSYDLKSVANTVLTNLRQTTENTNHTGFWNATNGRFVAGYASGEGKWYDYGYAAWNLEAIYYGIATEEQATAIMNWLNSEGKLYDYVFAPRSNTIEGTDMLNGEYAAKKGEWDFGDNCQYGGAIMYTSFYDLMARIDTLGADNAFARLTAIQNWYKEIYDYYVANGTDPYDFYRYYYDNKGIQCQGMGTAGEVGLDREFLESFLPVSAVAYGFFGIEANGSTLTIAPEKPAELSSWKMENLAFNFVKYDLTIFENAIQLNNVRGDVAGLKLTVALDYTEGTVYVNGIECDNYTVENGKAYVTVDMGATIVEVK